MIVSFSGHRPQDLFGFKPDKRYNILYEIVINKLVELNPDECISGMAIGFDTIAAEACVELEIPFIAAVPFAGQEQMWPKESQDKYKVLLSKAKRVHIVCEGGYAAWKMQHRNIWMVDNSDELIACFSGKNGGTKNCVDYAKKLNKIIHIINPLQIVDS